MAFFTYAFRKILKKLHKNMQEKDGAQIDDHEPCGREDGHLAKYGDMREEKRRERKDSRRKGARKAFGEIAAGFVGSGKRMVAVVNAEPDERRAEQERERMGLPRHGGDRSRPDDECGVKREDGRDDELRGTEKHEA